MNEYINPEKIRIYIYMFYVYVVIVSGGRCPDALHGGARRADVRMVPISQQIRGDDGRHVGTDL